MATRSLTSIACLLILLLAVSVSRPLSSAQQDFTQSAKVRPENGEPASFFGRAVALHGDLLAVGAPIGDGAAYLFTRDGGLWSQTQKLEAQPNTSFGVSLGVASDAAIVGAPRATGSVLDSGLAYVFERQQQGDAWTQTAVLESSDARSFDDFGAAVALDQDLAVVTAPTRSFGSGMVYVFRRQAGGAWTEVASFAGSDTSSGLDEFGASIAFDPVTQAVAVGAPGNGNGAVYLFAETGGPDQWLEAAKLTPDTPQAGSSFGSSVAIRDGTLVVGAWGEDSERGAVYVFETVEAGGGWQQTARLRLDGGAAQERFGFAVSLADDRLLVGTPHDLDPNRTASAAAHFRAGSAALFEREDGGWTEVSRLVGSGVASGDEMGRAVAIWGDRAAVGVPEDGDAGNHSGSVAIFDPGAIDDRVTLAGALRFPRLNHTATRLDDGRVAIIGGFAGDDTVEIFDPRTTTWSDGRPMEVPRSSHSATLLQNGGVLVVGGVVDILANIGSSEVYDPRTDRWRRVARQLGATAVHTATRLDSGSVLVSGGVNNAGNPIARAELFAPSSESWLETGSMTHQRDAHTATLLDSGEVLVVGGFGQVAGSTAELYDPASGRWREAADPDELHVRHTATRLLDGRVLVVGPTKHGPASTDPENVRAEIYDPVANRWDPTSPLNVARQLHTATRLADGRVLVAGGEGGSQGFVTPFLDSAELYDPETDRWSVTRSLLTRRIRHTATLLEGGRDVLLAGGYGLDRQPPLPAPVDLFTLGPSLGLLQQRFRVEVTWRDFQDERGVAQLVPFGSDNSGLLYFFDPENWEMLIKVLDGCAVNDRFWVFAAATTNVEYLLKVTDTATGRVREYQNPLGVSAPAITDADAFDTCSAPTSGSFDPVPRPAPRERTIETPRGEPRTASDSHCVVGDTALCLNDERFLVEVEWVDFAGGSGSGRVVPVDSSDSGLFWFFDPDNWEMLVKVLNGCAFNDHFWVFAAATTNVEYTLRVTDTLTGTVQEYSNPLGAASAAITDTAALDVCL